MKNILSVRSSRLRHSILREVVVTFEVTWAENLRNTPCWSAEANPALQGEGHRRSYWNGIRSLQSL